MFLKMVLFLTVYLLLREVSSNSTMVKMNNIVHVQDKRLSVLSILWNLVEMLIDGVAAEVLPLGLLFKYIFEATKWYNPCLVWYVAFLCSYAIQAFCERRFRLPYDRNLLCSQIYGLLSRCGIVALTVFLLKHTAHSSWMLLAFCVCAVCNLPFAMRQRKRYRG